MTNDPGDRRVTFMRVDRKFLDPDDRYDSAPVGSYTPGPTLGNGRDLILGIRGTSDGNTCRALGLLLRGKG